MTLFQTLTTQSDKADKYMAKFRDDSHASWEEKEALLLGRNRDSLTTRISKSRVFDPRLSTLIIERAARVMSQHSTGVVRALDPDSNKGQSNLMDMILQKYVIPGADSQWDLLTKYRMEMIYSNVYGSFGHIVDWRNDGDYVGPDMWLIPARDLYPEPNSVSVDDANYIFIDTWVTKTWLEQRTGKDWKNIKAVLEASKGKGSNKDSNHRSLAEDTYHDKAYVGKGKYQKIHLRTRYENDRWVTFAPDFAELKDKAIIRDIKNPHGNNEKPIVMKQTFPLLDRFWGLGDFERGKSLQYALNSLWNLYMDGTKMSIFPPMIYDPNGAVRSTLSYGPAARWAETKRQSIRRFDVSPQGNQTFQSTFAVLNSSLLNQAGTTDTTTTSTIDPGMGRTPSAIKFLSQREKSRDNWESFMMDKVVDKTMNKFIDLILTKQKGTINLNLFAGEIAKIQNAFPSDVAKDLQSVLKYKDAVNIKVGKSDLAKKYRFYIDPGSSKKKDDVLEHDTMNEILTLLTKIPGLAKQVGNGKVRIGDKLLDTGEMIKRLIVSSQVKDVDTIIQDIDPEEIQAKNQIMGRVQEFNDPEIQALAKMISGGAGEQIPGGAQQMPVDEAGAVNETAASLGVKGAIK